jgi:hypothetical protein
MLQAKLQFTAVNTVPFGSFSSIRNKQTNIMLRSCAVGVGVAATVLYCSA